MIYAAQFAWLATTPEKHKEARYKVFGWASLPELAPDEYLDQVWHQLGESREGNPLSWQELQAYATMTGTRLTAEEWETVYEMSRAYCSELQNRSPLAISPVEKGMRSG